MRQVAHPRRPAAHTVTAMGRGVSPAPTGAVGAADVAVIGAGPAGRAAATACAESGLITVLIDPQPSRRWSHTYGAWADELPSGHEGDIIARRWTDVRVRTDAGEVGVDRDYVLLANATLQDSLRRRFEAAGGVDLPGVVAAALVNGTGLALDVDAVGRGARRRHHTRMVVDASGHRPVLVRPAGGTPPLQTAFGLFGRWSAPPATTGAMTFMDFSTAGLSRDDRRPDAPATFLYAMDLGGGRWLAEETSLAARPAVPMAVLARRLHDRLDRRGALPTSIEAEERVAFPMGVGVPDPRQPVVGFGAAAGMVHPATGFQVARSLRTAPVLASALAEALGAGASLERAASIGWSAVWPPDVLRQRALQQLGLEALLRMDASTLQRFFRAFFRLERPDWTAFVSGARTVGELRRAMSAVFRLAPNDVRLRLAAAALRRPGLMAAGAGYPLANFR